MPETTEQFMARFRATGLDMLTEARRREDQMYNDWRWIRPRGDRVSRSDWKAARFMEHYHDPSSLLFDTFPRIITTVRPDGPPVRILRDTIEGLEPRRDVVIMSGRRVGYWSYYRQACAAALMAENFTALEERIAVLGHAFGTANQSLDEWVSSFGVNPYKPKPLLPVQSLGPGKEVEEASHRGYDPKRIAKDRIKKKLARRSKRK